MGVTVKDTNKILPGYRRACLFSGRVHLILRAKEYIYVHAGDKLYRIGRTQPETIKKPRPIAYLSDRRSVGISLGNRIIISDGERIIGVNVDGDIRILSEDPCLASCRSMAVWDGRLFLGGFDCSPDRLLFSAPLLGGLPQNLKEGEIWLDGILEIYELRCNGSLDAIGKGGIMSLAGINGDYAVVRHKQCYIEENNRLTAIWQQKSLTLSGDRMQMLDTETGEKYLAGGIAGFVGARRLYKYSPEASEGFAIHKKPHTPCEAEVMSLIDEGGRLIYFSVEEGKRYALYQTEIMVGGDAIDATALLSDEDILWVGNTDGGLFLYDDKDECGLFDGHIPDIRRL